MARTLHADTIAKVISGSVIPYFMVLVETGSGDLLLWSGIGDYVSSVSGISKTYIGIGSFGSISPIQESQDLAARGVILSLSGIPSALVSVFLADLQQGKPARIFMGFFADSTRVAINSEFEIWTGITDVPSMSEGGETATIAIACENRLIDLEKKRTRRYTVEDQSRDDVTDLGFDHVSSLQDLEILFGSSR
jgi:hypothetical protein